ncbi:hypothetical protein [Ferrimicrobium sp.]|uniref:hypothetical protein n=1 Tax=Ferrimicrobium sp. TaxID=2926050 RepID=UPI00262153E6|nr:hypothetical protein [Ferrimicrobium sp.]
MEREHKLDHVATGHQADPGTYTTCVCKCGARFKDVELLEIHCIQALAQEIQQDLLAMSRTQAGVGWHRLTDIAHAPDEEILSELQAWSDLEDALRAIEESNRPSDS